MSLAVIRPFAALGAEDDIALGDGEAHIGSCGIHNERDVREVGVRALEVAGVDGLRVGDYGTFGVDGNVRAGNGKVHALVKGNVIGGEVAVAAGDLNAVALNRVPSAVVGKGLAVALDGHDDLVLVSGDDELTGGRAYHLVVFSKRTLVELIGECVVGATDVGLAAGDIECGALAGNEAVRANGHVGLLVAS